MVKTKPETKTPGTSAPILDREDALERMEGDTALLEELLGLFREDYRVRRAAIDLALDAADGDSISREAHTVKGAAANLSLPALRESALKLETAGKEGRLDDARRLAAGLQSEFERLERFLTSDRGQEGSPKHTPATGTAKNIDAPRGGSKKKILVIDDAGDMRRLVAVWAEKAGIWADGAADGTKALARIESGPYDLILIDLNLGRQTGYGVLAGIRAMEERLGRSPSRVVAFSASVSPEVKEKCRTAGFAECLEKPLSREALKSLLPESGGRKGLTPDGTAVDLSIEDLIPSYIENRRADVRVMTAALEKGEWAVIESLAHKIKGSGSSYGFPELTSIGRELESAAHDAEADTVRNAIRRLADHLKKVGPRGDRK